MSRQPNIRVTRQAGQVVVEYVLLLTIAVSIAMLVISMLTKRDYDDPENSGAVIRKWQDMQNTVGKDKQN